LIVKPATIGPIIDETKDTIKVGQVHIRSLPNEPEAPIPPRRTNVTSANSFRFHSGPFSCERFLSCGRLDKESQSPAYHPPTTPDFAHPRANSAKIYSARMFQGFEDEGE
jgi:hypothetical protein